MTSVVSKCRQRLMLLSCVLFWPVASALSSDAATVAKKQAVVVGGGPVGLATALTLSHPPHCFDVTILEQAPVEQYDPTKAYLYNVNPRGQKWMSDLFPTALQKLKVRGSGGSMARITIVPGDPETPIPKEKKAVGGVYKKDIKKNEIEKEAPPTSFWIPRHSMICLLEDEIEDQMEAVKESGNANVGTIQLFKGKKFTCMEPSEDGQIQVSVEDVFSGAKDSFCGTLIVGADGCNSAVRDWLGDGTKETWLQSENKKFKVKRWISPASGLRMKVIQMPPNFELPDSDGSFINTDNERTYAIRGIYNGPQNYVSLGMLPVKDSKMIRPANVITRPDHEVWSLTDGPSAKKWFTDAFPRFNWDLYVDDKEWDRFAKAQGTTFPNCQYCTGLQVSSPDQKSGVVLLGDSIHAFPPDIGQGINAGLVDVLALDRALRGKDVITGEDKTPPQNIGMALQEYERVQKPQVAALIRISRFGFPYQYRQPWIRDRIGRFLMTCNIALRLILNKLTLGLVQPSCIMLLQKPELTFHQAMRRADLTTAGLWAVFLTVVYRVFGTSLKRLVGL